MVSHIDPSGWKVSNSQKSGYTKDVKRSKSVLIIGGSGFIGTHLCLRLRDTHKVYSTFFRNPVRVKGVTPIPMNALDREWVKRVIYTISPDVVVFAAGSNDAKWAEDHPKETDQIHSGAAVTIATTASILQPRFVFISNAFVFDGRKGNYKENDIVLPTNALGKAKLSSEKYFSSSQNYVIVRSSPLFGRGNGRNLSIFDVLRKAIFTGKQIKAGIHEYHTYAPIYGLIDILAYLVDGGPRNTTLHYGTLTRLNEYDFLTKLAKRFGLSTDLIIPEDSPPPEFAAKLHMDYSMNFTRSIELLKIKPLLLEEGFDLFEKELIARSTLSGVSG